MFLVRFELNCVGVIFFFLSELFELNKYEEILKYM